MINVKICFFTNLLQVFLISIFDVRWHNCAYLSCAHVPRRMKFTAFIDESAEENQFPANTVVFEILRSYFFCNYPFKFWVNIIQNFQGSNFIQFLILRVLYMYKETPEPSGKFH